MSNWINLPEVTDEYTGFVYIIKNNHPDAIRKYYIGCKQLLRKTRLKANKSRKRDKIVWRDNNIEKYWGSSKELLKDMELYGSDYFTREIIEMCTSKFHMKYAELHWQVITGCMFDEKSYNGLLNVRLAVVPKNYVDKPRDVSILGL
jgi:hypothetical protein